MLVVKGESSLLVSVHLPKTGGASFGKSLRDNFGSGLLRDYGDFPINTPQLERNKSALQNCLANDEKEFHGKECIHGHFLPIKYLPLSDRRNTNFITWLRNPVERVLSHYYYWQRTYNPKKAPALHKAMMEEKWSLERFCLGPEVKNLYSQFLYGFPLEYFSFIGITEFYDDDFAYFVSHYLGVDMEPEMRNVGKKGKGIDGYQISETMRNDIESYHSEDMDLYQRVLEMRLTKRS